MEMKTERSVEALFDGLSSPRGTGDVASKGPFFVMAGPCAVENEDITIKTAEQLKEITSMLGLPLFSSLPIERLTALVWIAFVV